jgi:hypothetical protein
VSNRCGALCAVLVIASGALSAETLAPLKPYIAEDSPVLVLEHVRVIDGSGSAPVEDQRIDIVDGKIARVSSAKLRIAYPAGAKVLNLTGKTVIPGIVGMHEHLFYPTPEVAADGQPMYGEMADSAPRLYLAGGVTTARTTGSLEPYTDLSLKKLIDAGQTPGPKLRITGPYLGDYLGRAPQLHVLTGPAYAARTVDYWADEGVTSFKAYMSITAEELKVAIEHAHARGLKVTGHLCVVGFREAAALGIDDLEHGINTDTEFDPDRKPGGCASRQARQDLARNVDINGAPVQDMIHDLVAHHVAITSTLAVIETDVPNRPALQRLSRTQSALTPTAWSSFLEVRSRIAEKNDPLQLIEFEKEMAFARSSKPAAY